MSTDYQQIARTSLLTPIESSLSAASDISTLNSCEEHIYIQRLVRATIERLLGVNFQNFLLINPGEQVEEKTSTSISVDELAEANENTKSPKGKRKTKSQKK